MRKICATHTAFPIKLEGRVFKAHIAQWICRNLIWPLAWLTNCICFSLLQGYDGKRCPYQLVHQKHRVGELYFGRRLEVAVSVWASGQRGLSRAENSESWFTSPRQPRVTMSAQQVRARRHNEPFLWHARIVGREISLSTRDRDQTPLGGFRPASELFRCVPFCATIGDVELLRISVWKSSSVGVMKKKKKSAAALGGCGDEGLFVETPGNNRRFLGVAGRWWTSVGVAATVRHVSAQI